ncbi:hypothetical protein ACOV11_28590, partial [Vibrio natriegens]
VCIAVCGFIFFVPVSSVDNDSQWQRHAHINKVLDYASASEQEGAATACVFRRLSMINDYLIS